MKPILLVVMLLALIPIVNAAYVLSGQADNSTISGAWDVIGNLNDSNPATAAESTSGDSQYNMTFNVKYILSNGLRWETQDSTGIRNITIVASHACIWGNAFHANVLSSPGSSKAYYRCFTSTGAAATLLYETNTTAAIIEAGQVLWNVSSPYFTMKDEKTEFDLVYPGTLQIFGSNYSVSYGTPTVGTMSLPSDVYNVRLSIPSPPYNTRNWYFDYNSSNPSINYSLYMLNYSYAQLTTFQVTDTANSPISGAYVKAYRQMIKTNDYQLVEMGLTDNNGNTVLSLEPYVIPYKIIVVKANETLFETTLPQFITSATNYIKINLLNDTTSDYFDATSVSYSLTYLNASKRIAFQFNDTADGNITAGKLDVTLVTSLTTTSLCSNTINATTGIIYCNISDYLNRTGTVFGNAYVQKGGEWYHLDTISKSVSPSIAGSLGKDGAVYAFMLITIVICIGLWNPIVAIVLGCAGLALSVAMGLIPLEYTWIIGLVALAFIGIRRQYA